MAENFDIETLRTIAAQGCIHWHQHALERFLERGISRSEVISALMNGEVIEVYPKDRPYPSPLLSFYTLRWSRCMWWLPPILLPGYVM